MTAVGRALDVALAAGALLVLLPALAVVAAVVAVTSGRPILHRAVRIGRHGRPFRMLKFRTMKIEPGPAITGAGDPRVTPLGRILRRARIDELPQLVNVLRGDMSLVGPRPEDPAFVALYSDEQRALLAVRPGITSPASLRFRDEERMLAAAADPETTYVQTVLQPKLAYELDWLATRTLTGDLALLVRSLGVLLAGITDRPSR
jgi:lipopolysaccharide/colanic/teichoic acid biosynthesis glycosyltransferase